MRHFTPAAIFLMAVAPLGLNAATFEWTGAIQPEQSIEIRNINGDIRAEPATGPDVEISVQITGTHPDPDSIYIDVVPHAGGILFCTIYRGLSRPEYCTPDKSPSVSLQNSDIKVSYIIHVPAHVNLIARTVNGAITADLPDSRVSLHTVNGRVVLSTNRPADVNVVNGTVLATLGAIDWADSHEINTVNGAIDLRLPENDPVTIRAAVAVGPIITEFPLMVHRTIVGSWLYDSLNGGGPLLFLNTVNGSIHLRRPAAQ